MPEVDPSNCIVLVVDDSSDTREMVALGLRLAGYQVQLAEDGLEALKVLTQIHCDLVVSDLTMPNMGGIDLLNAMRAKTEIQHLPFILMSAAHDDLALAASKTDGTLEKPFDFEKLLTLLSRIRDQRVR